MKKGRIAIISHEYPPNCGGAGYYVYELAEELSKYFNIDLYVKDSPDNFTKGISNVYVIKSYFPKILTFNINLKKYSKRIVDKDYDFIIHNEASGCFFSKNLYKKNLDLMIIYHLSINEPTNTYFRKFKLFIWQLLQDIMVSNSDKLIYLSEIDKKEIEKRYGRKEYMIVKNGISTRRFKSYNRRDVLIYRSKFEGKKIIFFPGGVTNERKGLSEFLNIVFETKKEYPNFVLLVSGHNNNLLNQINQKIQKLNLRENIIFLGNVDYKKIPLIYASADFIVFPSLYEGFGRPILESISASKFIITYNVGVAKDLIINTNMGVIVSNKNKFVSELIKTLNKDNLEIDKYTSKSILHNYSWSEEIKPLMSLNHKN